jgi:hypothetical protein
MRTGAISEDLGLWRGVAVGVECCVDEWRVRLIPFEQKELLISHNWSRVLSCKKLSEE